MIRCLALLFGASLFAVCSLPLPANAQQAPPNIVLILADDLGYGDVSYMSFAEDIHTPGIDRLADQGVVFDRFYANCPVCSPTRAALLTGRYPELVGVPGVIRQNPADSWGYLRHDAVLISEVLRDGGYHTALVGKWHLGYEPPNTPNARGFDHFHGFLGDMMDDYVTHRRGGVNWMRLDREEIDPTGHATDLFSRWACDYVRSRVDADAPFFLYLAYNAPHTPIQPPPGWLARVNEREPGIDERRARLVALIEHMDHGIGQVLDTLEETGAAATTLVVFTSDNGGQLNVGANCGPLRDGKGSLYEGGLRVPFAVRWPGVIEPGSACAADAMTMDLFPTLCEIAGLELEAVLDGRSLLPLLSGDDSEALEDAWPTRDLFWVRREGGGYMGQSVRAVRRGPWKLLQNSPVLPYELYNLEDDPHEERSVAGDHPQVVRELSAALRRQTQLAGRVPWQQAEQERDDGEARPLIGVGLAGWHVDAEHAGHWSNEDGTILGENENQRGSILWTDGAYGDFELTVEYQTDDEDYDSGIFLRADSHQVQIGISRSLQRDMTGCIYAPADGKGGYPGTTDDETIEEHHRLGEWNTLRIVVMGKRIRTFLNGEPFVDYEADTIPAAGPIGLQLHQGVHMKMRFRNIRVLEIEAD